MVERVSFAVVASVVADAPFDLGEGDLLPPPRAVTIFRVERVLKGPSVSDRIAVLHEVDPAGCGLGFAAEERYLLAFGAWKEEAPAPLRINLCGVRVLDAPDRRNDE